MKTDAIKVSRFRSTDYHGNTPAAKREIYRGLVSEYVMQTRELITTAKAERDLYRASHILAQAAYAMRQAARVQWELDHMDNTTNDKTKGDQTE